MIHTRSFRHLALALSLIFCAWHSGAQQDEPGGETPVRERLSWPTAGADLKDPDRWSMMLGLGLITSNTIGEIGSGDITIADGPGGGQIWFLGGEYTLYEFDLGLEPAYQPQLNLPMVLKVVDQKDDSPFFGYNLGLALRWRHFPWNNYLYTTIQSGVGITYTEEVLRIERERHENRSRSHLKFYWPIELTFALPNHPRHQMMLFLHHHSGGHVFDVGGSNVLGLGYRFLFGAP